MEKLTTKEIVTLKKSILDCSKNEQGRIYTDDIKKKIVQYHYTSGKSFTQVSKEFDIHMSMISKWKKKFGKQRTAFVFGKGLRNDLRTKALCVQEYKETGEPQHKLATKYGVSQGTVNKWIKTFEHEYKELLDTRDGVPYLVKESKMIYGDKNIEIVLGLLTEHEAELDVLIEGMHREGIMKNAILQVENKKKETAEEIELLQKADKIISKRKSKKDK